MRLPVQCLTPVRDYQPPGRFGPDDPGETHRRWLRYTPRLIVHVTGLAASEIIFNKPTFLDDPPGKIKNGPQVVKNSFNNRGVQQRAPPPFPEKIQAW